MPGIVVKAQTNGAELGKNLRRLGRSQVPFATAVAATKTAVDVKKALQDEMRQVLDRPTPYTINSLRIERATKANPVAEVLFKDYAADPAFRHYLEPVVYGGGRPFKAFERRLQRARVLPAGWYAVPGTGAKLDRYGNMNRGQIVQILAVLQALPTAGAGLGYQGAQTARSKKRNKKIGNFFASTPNNTQKAKNGGRLPFGVWERKGRGGKKVVNVLFFVPRALYRKQFGFWRVAQQVTRDKFTVHFVEALAKAIATAK